MRASHMTYSNKRKIIVLNNMIWKIDAVRWMQKRSESLASHWKWQGNKANESHSFVICPMNLCSIIRIVSANEKRFKQFICRTVVVQKVLMRFIIVFFFLFYLLCARWNCEIIRTHFMWNSNYLRCSSRCRDEKICGMSLLKWLNMNLANSTVWINNN